MPGFARSSVGLVSAMAALATGPAKGRSQVRTFNCIGLLCSPLAKHVKKRAMNAPQSNNNPSQEQSGPVGPVRSIEEAMSEIDRECKVRARCYDRWVAEGKLSGVDAKDRAERMQSALGYLTILKESQIPT